MYNEFRTGVTYKIKNFTTINKATPGIPSKPETAAVTPLIGI